MENVFSFNKDIIFESLNGKQLRQIGNDSIIFDEKRMLFYRLDKMKKRPKYREDLDSKNQKVINTLP